ncbi:MAG: M20/M25/M40 family metallo-hydrolase [Proteobacteria bacterium]|nr:M20/M25/M40 family metallo-hydrolase [Pseudomonadota bacterium]
MPHPAVPATAARASAQMGETLDLLADYLAIPAISCEAEHHADVRLLAARIRDDLEKLGLSACEVLELDGALPIVVAEWMKAGADKPTVLIYGHLDLQPVEIEHWNSDPHVPTRRGDRLYARGSADDMGGWVSHMGAIRAWLEETGELPCNVRLVIEGEEEIGSPNLERFMDAYPKAFEADVMVLTDCENPSVDVPGLTVSLRGLLEVELTCEALGADVHSGLWGGMVPDVSIALIRLIARLTDEDGRMAVGRVDVPQTWRKAAWDVPLDEATIRDGAHIVEGVDPLPARDIPPAEWLWRQPSITVVATTLPTAANKKNALRRTASATLSIRLAPDQSAEAMFAVVKEALTASPPAGVKVSVAQAGWAGEGWLYEPSGPAFDAVDRAYEATWGTRPVQVGVGGSIPFVALFGKRFGDLPLILNGVMDPRTTAHGPNESLHVGIFAKAVAANVHLLAELGALGKTGVKG